MDSSLQTLVANVGFPIAISMYLLDRIEGKLNSLTDRINKLSNNINIIKSEGFTLLFFINNIINLGSTHTKSFSSFIIISPKTFPNLSVSI